MRRAPILVEPPAWAARVPDFWAVVENFDYALPDVRRIRRSDAWELREAAREAADVIDAAVRHAQRTMTDADLIAFGIPKVAVDVVRRSEPHATTIGRFDFIRNDDGLHVIEYNAETPFLVWESFGINGIACAHAGLDDPNATSESTLIDALRRTATRTKNPDPVVGVIAYNPYREDWYTGRWYERAWRRAGARARTISITDLRMRADGVGDANGRIDVLHRCYPLEHLEHDRDGAALLKRIADGDVEIVNPGSALIAQNKRLLERIWTWGSAKDGPFDERQRNVVRRLFLPTFMERPAEGTWVRKPIFGREGNTVSIHRAGEVLDANEHAHYAGQPAIWQAHAEIPPIRFRHAWGEMETGWPILTCFVVEGEPGPISMRIGDPITSAWAHFQPLGFERRKR